ncbi:uncharacterized protein LOC120634598 [Pararge aegeria]|uniref:uncharacterized protein LOC120634598 n=1 Tax=Pararge aegeria TaxID=116150 RepID=UPI0019D0DEDA|nr:uncharacterized protein LOC120634598 [Pararge aegeria]XP_039761261.1 uncharacterized protein LOC120634598 [Pararge aegeria]
MKWFNSVSTLKNFNSDFQIIIEGVTGSIRILMKIDDVALLRGSKCYAAKIAATTPAWLYLYETSTTSTTFVPSTTISTTTPTTPTTQTSKTTTTTTQRSFGVNDTLSCAFLNGDFCGWKNDLGAIDRWLSKDNYIYFDEPSWLGNSSVRLISPTYRSVLNSNGCFFFSYKMYTKSHSRSTVIRIYQKPDYVALEDLVEYSDEAKLDYIIYEIWGDLGDYWYDNISTLRKYDHKFQIIIEGIFGQDRMFMAIDDVSILQGSDCPKTTTTTTSTPTTPTTIETTDANTTTPMLATTQRQREETTTTTKTSTSTTPTINSTTTILILTTTQRQREDNNVDGVDLPTIAITLAVILVLVILVTVLTWKRSRTDSSNALWTYIMRKYGRRNNSEDTKAPGVEYSTKNAEVEISCN